MSSQHSFRAALLDAATAIPDGLHNGGGAPAGRRFDVYRNNVAVSLTEALQTSFPVLRKLLGPGTFDRLAGVYLRAHPPKSPLMMHYGSDLPAFLDGFAPLHHIGYLPDVARLENAIRASYHAADAPAIDSTALAAIPAEALGETRLTLAPAVRRIPSDWPLYDIWRFNTEDGAPKPEPTAQSVLITRAEFDPLPHRLTPGDAACLAQLAQGDMLANAVAAAQTHSPDFDLSPLLGHLLAQNAIIHVTT